MGKIDFRNSEYYTNRELSWIQFDERVLSEAQDKNIPLFERIKFLGITASNLDEFFMVRVASLKDMVHAGYKGLDISGMSAKQQLKALGPVTHGLVEQQYHTFRQLKNALKEIGVEVIEHHEEMSEEQKTFADEYFMDNVYPVLTPMAVDSSRPFPLLRNKTLNLGALLSKKMAEDSQEEEIDLAVVQVPDVLDRVVVLKESDEENKAVSIIFLEEIIERNLEKLFLNYDVLCVHPFRIMRNADFEIDEDEAEDLLKEIEKQLKKRQWGEAIRLEVEKGCDAKLLKRLANELKLEEGDIYDISGPLDLTVMSKVYKLPGFEDYKAKPFTPQMPKMFESGRDIFEQIREGDKLLMLPYESFDPVVDFIKSAARDPKTLAIKMTLYRVSGNSPIISALAQAAENGKQVSVLVELKARFDEENNIVWAKKLEKAGCHVIYGLVGLKTHSKIALVVRREEDGIRRYVHLGTGNYNDVTARLYTDMGLFSCSVALGEDATAVFNMLSGYSEPLSWNRLALAPLWLKDRFLELIGREKENALAGKEASIVAKMNSLCDPDVIAALYEASAAGVQIDLIVRGICCLKTGIEGVSEHITVRSIVGDFLEHSRIFIFKNGGKEEIFMASADWMPRNLERRVEILFPVEEENLKEELREYMRIQLADTVKARFLHSNGSYQKKDMRTVPEDKRISCQKVMCERAIENAKKKTEDVFEGRVFIPKEHAGIDGE